LKIDFAKSALSNHNSSIENMAKKVLATVLPLFCHVFTESITRRPSLMNELNMSSFIQIMQTGLMTHDKQESAGRFLLESVTMLEDSLCTTNLDSKKNKSSGKPERPGPRRHQASRIKE
jgi:hypothetical protein